MARLDNNKIISHTLEDRLKKPRKELYKEVFPNVPEGSGSQLDRFQARMLEQLQEKATMSRVQMLKTQIAHEIAWADTEGWSMVFNTLTVRDDHYNEVFDPGSKAFKNYIRKVDNAAAKAAYGSVRKAQGKDFHEYVAVIERGGKRGRLHIHVLHMVKVAWYSDPNAGSRYPIKREVDSWKQFWPFGFTTPIAVRYAGDAYSKRHWRWPVDQRGKAIPAKSPQAVGSYVSKYVLKAHTDKDCRRDYPWRIRKKNSFGKKILMTVMSTMTDKDLISLTRNQMVKVTVNDRSVPKVMIRRMAFNLLLTRHQLDGNLGDLLTGWLPQDTPIMRSRNSIRTILECNSQSFSNTMTKIWPNTVGSDDYRAARDNLEAGCRRYFKNRGVFNGFQP